MKLTLGLFVLFCSYAVYGQQIDFDGPRSSWGYKLSIDKQGSCPHGEQKYSDGYCHPGESDIHMPAASNEIKLEPRWKAVCDDLDWQMRQRNAGGWLNRQMAGMKEQVQNKMRENELEAQKQYVKTDDGWATIGEFDARWRLGVNVWSRKYWPGFDQHQPCR